MRPLVPSFTALAVVALYGAFATGTSPRSPERDGGGASGSDGVHGGAGPLLAPTTVFYGGSSPDPLPLRADLPAPLLPPPQEFTDGPLEYHEFYFTRAIYSDYRSGLRGWGRRRGSSWSIDWPKADRQFMVMVDHLLRIDLYPDQNAVRLDDPNVRRFPFLYALEVGAMHLTDSEVHGLRGYLDAGGFLVIDDFWGPYEWENFEREISRVLPGRPIVEIPLDHPLFHTFYDIEEILQVPNVSQGRYGGPTWEKGGRVPHVRGIFDDKGHLMVVINYNTDLGDAWEWAEDPYYPLKYSRFAAEMGINMIVYGLSH